MLSIIIPTLNEAANLERRLSELSREPGVEIIVADGGSTDGSEAVLARHPSVRKVESNRGRARQMNAGARAATGHTLLFLHADTRLPAGVDAAIREALTDPRVVGGRFDVHLDSARPILRVVAGTMNLRSRLTGISTGDQAIFVRRGVFETMGGYPDIPLMEDVEFTRRLKRRGRLTPLTDRVTTSARKWEREGAVRTILLMGALRFLYFMGVSPDRLHLWYYPGLRVPPAAQPPCA